MNDKDMILIPELASWNNGAGISLKEWISAVGRFDHALGYATIFWPKFFRCDSCILRVIPDDAVFQQWMKSMAGDCARVEAMLNHLHLIDLFTGLDYPPSGPLLLRLGQILKEMWSCKLAQDFPDKFFEIHLTSGGEEMTNLELTFFQSSEMNLTSHP